MNRAALLLLALAGCASPPAAPAPVAQPAAQPPAAQPPAAQPPSTTEAPQRPQIREIDGAVPDDMQIVAHADGAARSTVRLHRKGQMIALRRGSLRAGGFEEATLAVPHHDDPGEPFVWEATRADTLETTRGLVQFDVDGRPHLRLADPPRPLEREARWHHDCRSQEDGEGGFTVLCRLQGVGGAVQNLTGASPTENTWSVSTPAGLLTRFDLPARPGSVDGRVIGYSDGVTAVVLRVEESFLPGEARPTLAMLASSRPQPVQIFPSMPPPPRMRDPVFRDIIID